MTLYTKYYISEDNRVFISVGAKNAVLYDMKTSAVFHVTHKLAENIINNIVDEIPGKIQQILEGNYNFASFDSTNISHNIRLHKVFVDLTNVCNYNCQNCYHKNVGKSFISTNILDKILDLPIASNATLTLLGGEPLLFPENLFLEYMERFHKKFKNIILFTNGSKINTRIADNLKKFNVLTRLTLHSIFPEKHDAYTRVANSFQDVLKKLRFLAERQNKVELNLILDKEDYLDSKKLQALIQKYDGIGISIDIRRPSFKCEKNLIKDRIEIFGSKRKPLSAPPNLKQILKNLNYHPCYTGTISIDTVGNVFGCPWMRKKCLGNIDGFLSKKCKAEDYLKWKQPIHKKFDMCKHCEFNFLCFICDYMDDAASQTECINNANSRPYSCSYNPLIGKCDAE